jgi:hypothetical protein
MKRRRVPAYGWAGLLGMATVQVLLAAGSPFAATWLTPLMWTGYILAADAATHARGGEAWLVARRREFPLLVLLSVAVWLGFEAYNLHLRNWAYRGVPTDPWLRDLGYFWSFATIMPGVFVTASLFKTFRRNDSTRRSGAPLPPLHRSLAFLSGAAMVTLPVLVPPSVAAYLFAPVWIGFFLLLDPTNDQLGVPSLWGRWRAGDRWAAGDLLAAGLACGLLWEAWNWQAFQAGGGHWAYTIPDALRVFGLHFGQMPLLGLLGFPPFALELFASYQFLRAALGGDRLFGTPASASRRGRAR